VEYQVRDARITDVEPITVLLDATAVVRDDASWKPMGRADLLRQLIYLPQAVVLVAVSKRVVVGAAVLALRPSVVQGGMVGSVDFLAVARAYEGAGVQDDLVSEVLRSARNKGCVAVEAALPPDPAQRDRWAGYGFAQAGPRMVRDLAPQGAARH
jgi:ribosomal protein S18 acetylase RimI-like enzyme